MPTHTVSNSSGHMLLSVNREMGKSSSLAAAPILKAAEFESNLETIFARHKTSTETLAIRSCLKGYHVVLSKLDNLPTFQKNRTPLDVRDNIVGKIRELIRVVDVYVKKIEQKHEDLTLALEDNNALELDLATREMSQIVHLTNKDIEKIQYDSALKIAEAAKMLNRTLTEGPVDAMCRFFADPVNNLKSMMFEDRSVEAQISAIDQMTGEAHEKILALQLSALKGIDESSTLLERRVKNHEDATVLKDELIAAFGELKQELIAQKNHIQTYDSARASLRYIRKSGDSMRHLTGR